jgi:hypothetical protein
MKVQSTRVDGSHDPDEKNRPQEHELDQVEQDHL